MDSSEETVFLHIQSHGVDSLSGNIYISDGSGKFYSLSLEDSVKGLEFVDFEKINSLEGVFIANKYDYENINRRRNPNRRTTARRDFSD